VAEPGRGQDVVVPLEQSFRLPLAYKLLLI
jgi:hypothetical protein